MMLCRADPLTPDLDHVAIAQVVVKRTTTDALVRLENEDPPTCLAEGFGSREPCETGPNDRYVDRDMLHHVARPSSGRWLAKAAPRGGEGSRPDGSSQLRASVRWWYIGPFTLSGRAACSERAFRSSTTGHVLTAALLLPDSAIVEGKGLCPINPSSWSFMSYEVTLRTSPDYSLLIGAPK
jgi:hypothetical protein